MAYREFWVSFGIALPFIAASGVAFFSLATNSFHGTALCLCFFVLLTVIMLAPGDSPGAFLLYTGLMVFYGVSAVTFFRTVREKWAAHMAMRTFAHKTGFFTHK